MLTGVEELAKGRAFPEFSLLDALGHVGHAQKIVKTRLEGRDGGDVALIDGLDEPRDQRFDLLSIGLDQMLNDEQGSADT